MIACARGSCFECGRSSRREGARCWDCHVENMRAIGRAKLVDRFWSKVDASGDCWEWTGTRVDLGYGQFDVEGRGRPAHRFAYELLVGPIPTGLEIDHRCRNTGCVNPDHLEVVTHLVNIRRSWRVRRAALRRERAA